MTDRSGNPIAAGKSSVPAPTARRVCGFFDDHERLEEAVSWLEGSLFVRADMTLVCECHEPGNGTPAPLGAEVVVDLRQARAGGGGRALADLAAEGLVVLASASTMAAATGGVVLAVRAGSTCREARAKGILCIAGATRIWTQDPAIGPAP